MRKALSVLFLISFMSVSTVLAADTPEDTNSNSGTIAPVLSTSQTGTTAVSGTLSPRETSVSPQSPSPIEFNAATTTPPPVSAPSAGSSLGEYKSVACTTNPAFTTNSCNQCFIGGSLKAGESITGLFDNWTNTTDRMLIAYKDEQKLPNMVSFGETTWTSTPTDLAKFWKNSSDIIWVPSGGSGSRMNYILQGGQKVKFLEAEFGARYTLDKTDKKNGDLIGLLRFPIVSHSVDPTTGTEGAATTHYECVSYTLSAPTTPPPEVKPVPPAPTPAEVTQTATGPAETLILIIAAFFIAFGMMFSLRKRV